jgi:hypothetical protein
MQTDAEVPLGWARLLVLEAGDKLAAMQLRSNRDDLGMGGEGFNQNLDEAIDGLWN